MLISPELKNLINPDVTRSVERRRIVPVSYVHQTLLNLALERHPHNAAKRDEVMARYSPLAEWLVKPRSIEQFMGLKSDLLYLSWDTSPACALESALRENLRTFKDNTHPYVNENYYKWRGPVNWLLRLSAELRILDLGRVHKLKVNSKNKGMGSTNYLWNEVEGWTDKSYEVPNATELDQYMHYLSNLLQVYRNKANEGRGISRVGVIFGDFRIADHKAHRHFIRNARMAVGMHGWLEIVIPTKRTILNTTDKTDCWPDDERVDRLSSNPHVNHVFLAHMPKKDYAAPERYWRQIWRNIHPDLVFLGERHHPLESAYRTQSAVLGGMLLIDTTRVDRRSRDLLKVKE